VQLVFPLLNSGEFFIMKLLLNGSPSPRDISFNITADELPPVIKPQYLPNDAISTTSEKREFDVPLLIFGIMYLLFGSSIFSIIYSSWSELPLISNGLVQYIQQLGIRGWSILVSIIPTLFFILIVIML
jgi:hypothetical protein